MKVVAILQARMGSTRLPRKVLLELAGKTVVEHVVDRVKMASKVDSVVVATSVSSKDDELAEFLKEKGIEVFRGSEEDVLDRYYEAAKKYDVDVIVRVCADCPLADPIELDKALESHISGGFDYTSNKKELVDGTGAEIFNMDVLEKVKEVAEDDYDKEHIITFIEKHDDMFKLKFTKARDPVSRYDIKIAVDKPEDYELLKEIYSRLYKDGNIELENVVEFVDSKE